MKLNQYLDAKKLEAYVKDGTVNARYHDYLPLVIFTYGRKAVHENIWDDVTTKCRGLIINCNTEEIIARPFEKFFNYETDRIPETKLINLPVERPMIFDKLDGFMCTLYQYEGKNYVASKGSFHSDHAKWATNWYNKKVINPIWPEGYTPVFEGIAASVQRIVVNYDFEELVLLALINIDTGEEMGYNELYYYAKLNGMRLVDLHNLTLSEAATKTLEPEQNVEGFVCVWLRNGMTPLRVKIKYTEYLRLHHMVTQVTPKRIWEALSDPTYSEDLKEYITNSTPEFKQFAEHWINKLTQEYTDIAKICTHDFNVITQVLRDAPRKDYAMVFKNLKYPAILFAMLDGKDVKPFIWKECKKLTKYQNPLMDMMEV